MSLCPILCHSAATISHDSVITWKRTEPQTPVAFQGKVSYIIKLNNPGSRISANTCITTLFNFQIDEFRSVVTNYACLLVFQISRMALCIVMLPTFLLLLMADLQGAAAVTTLYDSQNYIKYEVGNIPVIIAAPHGGNLRPSGMPSRNYGCWDAVKRQCIWSHDCGRQDESKCQAGIIKDSYTAEIAKGIADELEAITRRRPHVVYNLLHRSRLDANRERDEATFGVSQAVQAYQAYGDFIQQAKDTFDDIGILFDIHGQTHTLADGSEWTEIGYVLCRTKLNTGVFEASDASIKNLGLRQCGRSESCFRALIRGSQSFGGFLEQEGYQCVPSPSHPSPRSESYFTGGHTVKTYGSKCSGKVDAIQLEIPRYQRFHNRENFSRAVARAINNFMNAQYPEWK